MANGDVATKACGVVCVCVRVCGGGVNSDDFALPLVWWCGGVLLALPGLCLAIVGAVRQLARQAGPFPLSLMLPVDRGSERSP